MSKRYTLCYWVTILALGLIGVAPVTALAGEVTLGGWAGFVYADNDKAGNKRYFDAHPWYLYVQAEPTEGYRFFGEIEAEHVFRFKGTNTGLGELKLERLYIEREFSTQHNIRGGKFFMPFGYWNRLHWHFLTETLSRPISFDNAYAPRSQVGLQYFGRAFSGNTTFNYYAWLSNGPDQFGTNNRSTEDFGYGGSVFLTHNINGAVNRKIGAVVGYHGQSVAAGAGEENQQNFVAGVEANIERIELRGEYYHHGRDAGDIKSWYANAQVKLLPRFGVNYRIDKGDDLKGSGSAADPDRTSHSIGFVWRPESHVLLKGEYRINQFSDNSVTEFKAWNVFVALKY